MKSSWLLFIVFFILLIGLGYFIETPDQPHYYQLETDKPIEEVLDDAIFAITERNFRLTNHMHIGQAIRNRINSNFPDYEVLLYCNLSYAKKILELDPNMINSCPGRLIIRQDKDKIRITAPLWPEQMENNELRLLIQKMNKFIREIVEYAADDWLLVYD